MWSVNKCFLAGLLLCLFLTFFLPPVSPLGAEVVPEVAKVPSAEVETVPSTIYYTFTVVDNHSEIVIQSDGSMEDYRYFSLENPPRLVVDVKEKKLPLPSMRQVVDRTELDRIRAAQRGDDVRFVFDLPGEEKLHYQVVREAEWLKVIISPDVKPVATPAPQPAAEEQKPPSLPKTRMEQKKSPSMVKGKQSREKKISLDLFQADLEKFFSDISNQTGFSFSLAPDVKGKVSLRITDVPWDKAVDMVLEYYQLQMVKATDRPAHFKISIKK